MKIGIITFHRANNLGAVLQASALLKYMQDNYGECELIDFYPNNSIPNNTIIRKIMHSLKRILTFPLRVKVEEREKKFELYRNKFYKLSKQTYYGDTNIKNKAPVYDVLISGSDQILNVSLTGKSTAYYLDFDDKSKKISYASSFGRADISKEEIELVKTEFSKFHAISVREQSAAKIIKNVTDLNATLVVDPVFLLSTHEWEGRCNSNMKLMNKYIFVYSMEVSENLEIVVNTLKKEYNLPVIIVRGGGQTGRIDGKEDLICGPAEFLRYIRDAEFIITNSFHGIAFSIIFEKKFVSLAHSTRNTRLENIMNLINKNNCLISGKDKASSPTSYIVDGKEALDKMKPYIKNAKAYIKNSLQ